MAYLSKEDKENKSGENKYPKDKGFRISGSIMAGKKFIQFTKEVNAPTRNEAVNKAFDQLKKQHRVATYQIIVDEIKEGRVI